MAATTPQPPSGPWLGRHAVVIGGSMAGLLAARVLADHFERVTLVERDRFPAGPQPRKGTPQARHVHILLVAGRVILEQLFPGLEAELLAGGALALDSFADVWYLLSVGWAQRFPSHLRTYSCSRDFLEWCVRRRVLAYGNIACLEACDVVDLMADRDRRRVVGVRLRRREAHAGGAEGDGDGHRPDGHRPDDHRPDDHRPDDHRPDDHRPDAAGAPELEADFVVDASGRSSRAPEWLAALGYPAPEEETINAFLGYATRVYARPAGFQAGWKALFLQNKPPTVTRGGGLFPLEGDRWIATLTGVARDFPPTDEAGFLEFARSLRSPLLYEAIRSAQPLTSIVGYQRTANRIRYFERLARQPESFVALGDAVCAFNPVYAQGMTVAGQSALTLDRCLRGLREQRRHTTQALDGLAQRFQHALAQTHTTPWLIATGEDFRYPTTEGRRPGRATRLAQWYLDGVLAAAVENREMAIAFNEVVQLIHPPGILFRPNFIARVMLDAANGRRARAWNGANPGAGSRAPGAGNSEESG